MHYHVVFVSCQIALLDSPTALSMEEKLQQNEARVTSPLIHNSTRNPWTSYHFLQEQIVVVIKLLKPSLWLCSLGSGAHQRMDKQVERNPEHTQGDQTSLYKTTSRQGLYCFTPSRTSTRLWFYWAAHSVTSSRLGLYWAGHSRTNSRLGLNSVNPSRTSSRLWLYWVAPSITSSTLWLYWASPIRTSSILELY